MRTHRRATSGSIPTSGKAGRLGASLSIPTNPIAIVVFAHVNGTGGSSPRNAFLADRLAERGFATLLSDLLTEAEARVDRATGRFRTDVALLAQRLLDATKHVHAAFAESPLPIGYFGASTGAAAALVAAARHPNAIYAVVSRSGRPDLAGDAVEHVAAPTLLIVGGNDDAAVIELNRQARQRLPCRAELAVLPQASHLFEEPGALEEVAELAACWFTAALEVQ